MGGCCVSYPVIEVLYLSDNSFLLGDSNGFAKYFNDIPPPFYVQHIKTFKFGDQYYQFAFDLLYK